MNLIMLNLFLAILLANFETDASDEGEGDEDDEKTMKKLKNRLKSLCRRCCNIKKEVKMTADQIDISLSDEEEEDSDDQN